MKKKIAFFDFDGTITTRDTLLAFIRFSKGIPAFVLGFLIYSPWILAFKLGIISNQSAKEKVLSHFFKGMPATRFNELCVKFAKSRIPGLLRRGATQEIELLKQQGFQVVVVSASPENWIHPWTEARGIGLLASQLILSRDRLTGKIRGANCHGEEKVRRIRLAYDLSEFAEIYAYGDSSGDKPMLELATRAHYKPFRTIA